MEQIKLWIARNEGWEEEYLHDRYQHVPGELLICYDRPTLKYDDSLGRQIWKYARIMHEAPSYMFPEIKEKECVEFEGLSVLQDDQI